MKAKIVSLAVAILMLLGALVVPVKFAGATYPTTLRVDPTEIHKWSDVDHPGDTFEISIIADVVPPDAFFGWEFVLTWTPGIVNCVGEELNLGIWGPGNFLGPWVPDPIDNTAGTYHQSVTGKSPGTPKSGTFWLANLTFQIVAEPGYGQVIETLFHLQCAPGYTAYCLLDINSEEIEHYYVDGHYYYHWAPPKVYPHLEVEYTGEPGVHSKTFAGKNIYKTPFSFSVDINIYGVDSGWRLAGVELLLLYNTTVLDVLEVQQGTFFESFTPVTWFFSQIFEDQGKIRIVYTILDIPHMTPPYGSGKIATIVFNATYQEKFPASVSSPLDIQVDFENGMTSYFVNFLADEIPYDPEVDGYYTLVGYVVGRVIDVYTQWPDPYGGQGPNQPSDMYWPQKEVILYANVTYNEWPEQNKDVAFQVIDPHGDTYTVIYARTNEYGVATTMFRLPWPCDDPEYWFGVWQIVATVDVACKVVNDTLEFKYDYHVRVWKTTLDKSEYSHCNDIVVTIEYGTVSQRVFDVLFTITGVDETGVPFGFAYGWATVGGAEWCTYANGTITLTIHVPKFARAGLGTIYVQVLHDWPTLGGDSIYPTREPETIVHFGILAS